jgi:predicted nuclease of restriction endonuclease-like (RecB) superfamily
MASKRGSKSEKISSSKALQPTGTRLEALPSDYGKLLHELKARIRSAQIKAGISVNREMILLYWEIGRQIFERQSKDGWGSSVVERLSMDLRREFPDIKGFSERNLWNMRSFFDGYKDRLILQQLVAEIPWGHNLVLMSSVKDMDEREWYIKKTIEHGWSRNILVHQIESGLYQRQGRAATNFEMTLPPPQSDLAREVMKDPYVFDFLSLGEDALERDLQKGLLEHIREFLIELGVGFAFVGSQYHLEVGGEDYYIDLLFYHLKLRAFVVIDLKTGKFKPEYAGKMNFYLSAVDDILRHPEDKPSIGIILCKDKGKFNVEYALKDINKPMGVAKYEITRMLPQTIKGSLPSIEEFEAELEKGK